MTISQGNLIVLESKDTNFVLNMTADGPCVLYWGEKLSASTIAMTATLLTRQTSHGVASKEASISLCPTRGSGFTGLDGIQLHRNGRNWDSHFIGAEIVKHTKNTIEILSSDKSASVSLAHKIILDHDSNVLSIATSVTNGISAPLTIDWCCAATIQLPSRINQITGFHGRWANEFQTQKIDQFTGAYVRENVRGRTSHDNFPGLLAHTKYTTELDGHAYGFHLGWSGNHRTVSERMFDGRSFVQMGEKLLAAEVILQEGERYQSPNLYASYSAAGFSGLSQNFHRFVRSEILRDTVKARPRPVHYNTWEAVYFNHDVNTLITLANKAKAIGAERFVLDDGWFKGRRDDTAGLGDWYVDTAIYPDGLHPLVNHVLNAGMEFGLWVEPEMVNPDSDLYRKHPDWVLKAETAPQIPFRNQLVLDLTKQEVRDYLFERLDSLLTEYHTSYLKWDMNRDIYHPGSNGYAVTGLQVRALYGLLDKLRLKHPDVEIESCASGGARIDYGILSRTDRLWTSDSNDALDRLNIQRGLSFFFPSNVMGAHVGPRDCHITRRVLPADLRAATALFGHMGMELDLNELTDDETKVLTAAITFHKKHRHLIHHGNLVRLDSEDHASTFGIVSENGDEALFSYTQTKTRDVTTPEVLYFAKLAPLRTYKLDLLWPLDFDKKTTSQLDYLDGHTFTGEALMKIGLQLPHMHPATTLVFGLKATIS
ncbi:alpha-galactosidase [Kordiimonas aquimaris]|uniref:alpha-galactosidase n=1 Tax=Kordiimonas aquimaris TaxID=707591 RepID=UPI0021CFB167|nr:alpha-galactosidase [Kordiimonas aquimaris]